MTNLTLRRIIPPAMQTPPPPRSKNHLSRTTIVLICVAVLAVIVGAVFTVHQIIASGIARGPDNMFGDQHLKTSVALIELHKVRFGKYPGSLSDLKFTGQWDQIALQSVRYYPNPDRSAYYIEVETGWIGKPDLQMPDEFWHGTGYTTTLKPKK